MKFDCLLIIIIFVYLISNSSSNEGKSKQHIEGDKFPDDAYLIHKLEKLKDKQNEKDEEAVQIKKQSIKNLSSYINENVSSFEQLKSIINENKGNCLNIYQLSTFIKDNLNSKGKAIENIDKENLLSLQYEIKKRKNYMNNDEYGNLLIFSFNEDLFDRNNFLRLYFVSKM